MSFDFEFFAERSDCRIDMGRGYQRAQALEIGNLPAQLLDELSGSLFLAQFNGLRQARKVLARAQKSRTRGCDLRCLSAALIVDGTSDQDQNRKLI